MNPLTPPVTRLVHGWTIAVYEVPDPTLPWQVSATNGLIYHEAARGIDCEGALCSIAEKTGLQRHEVLDAFGLDSLTQ